MVYSQWLDRQPETDPDTLSLDPVAIARSFEFQGDEAGLHQHLRVQANAWFAQIIRAEFEQSAPLEVIGAALSAVAAGALESALSHYWPVLVQRSAHRGIHRISRCRSLRSVWASWVDTS